MDQQRLKIEFQAQEIAQSFEEFCTCVYTKATQLESGFKLN